MEQDIFEEWGEEANTSSTTANNTNNSSQSNPNNSNNNGDRKNRDMPPHQDSDLGEAPDYPAIYFVYNHETQKLEVRDRRGKIKQEIPILTINGTNGESAYTLWLKDHQGSIVDFMESLKGANGKNGKNAYEEWKEWQGPDADVSHDAYWNYFKGENGKSAFELWKEVHGEKVGSTPDDFFEYLKGQNGKDAFEVWQDLGYKNSTREDFFKWIASLVKTQKGEDGKVFYPHFDGFTIYFTEDLEGKGTHIAEKDIRGKDGRTFEPVFNGTELHFDDKEGHKTDPVDLRGKDAFELWKEYHHKPDAKYEEFEEYFKGQNVIAKHTYKDIHDFTCPVQTIDTDLIANVLDTGTSPDNLIKLRQEDIDNLRNKGNERNDVCISIKKIKIKIPYFFLNGSIIFKNWAGWFKEFSWWCAGADRGLLRMCPGDHSKYTGIGTVILFTALMAWFSSFVAMDFVFDNRGVATVFACFWSAMIFFLDRFITNTMYSDGKVSISKEEFVGALPRILISIFLGIVISAPLELIIFDKEIKEFIADGKITNDQEYQSELLKLNNEKNKIYEELNDYYALNLPDKNNPYFLRPTGEKKDTIVTEMVYKGRDDNGKKIFTNETKKISADITAFDPELYKSEFKTFKDNYLKEKERAENKLSQLSQSFDSIRLCTKTRLIAECDSGQFKSGLYERLSAMHSIAMKEGKSDGYKPLFSSIVVNNSGDLLYGKSENQVTLDSMRHKEANNDSLDIDNLHCANDTTVSENLNNIISTKNYHIDKTTDLIAKIIISIVFALLFALLFKVKIAFDRSNLLVVGLAVISGTIIGCNYEMFHYLWYYLTTPIGLIMLLFILIDISPVLYKMMLADGVYDNYLHQEKLLAQDKIRLSLARMLRNIEKGELKSLSPFIMGKIYRKLMKFSYSKDGKYEGQKKDYKNHIDWEEPKGLNEKIGKTNEEVFNKVLDYKKRIILASYAAWYRDMRDAMIGKKDDEEGSKITPDAHLYENDTQQEHTDKNEDAKTDSNTQQNDEANDGSESSSQDKSSDEK